MTRTNLASLPAVDRLLAEPALVSHTALHGRRVVTDAVRDEPLIVARQGLVFVNIPIRFDDPSDADVDTFAAVLRALGPRKVLVHCQVNFRASALVFLYRTTVLGEAPRAAWEALSGVWVPNGAWRKLIERRLRERGVEFDLL